MPRPISAIASGRPAATTEPNAISSTIAAPRNPSPSGLDWILRGVDRVAAELDLQAVAAVLLGGVDQLLAARLR